MTSPSDGPLRPHQSDLYFGQTEDGNRISADWDVTSNQRDDLGLDHMGPAFRSHKDASQGELKGDAHNGVLVVHEVVAGGLRTSGNADRCGSCKSRRHRRS